jgi:hypothetical protein
MIGCSMSWIRHHNSMMFYRGKKKLPLCSNVSSLYISVCGSHKENVVRLQLEEFHSDELRMYFLLKWKITCVSFDVTICKKKQKIGGGFLTCWDMAWRTGLELSYLSITFSLRKFLLWFSLCEHSDVWWENVETHVQKVSCIFLFIPIVLLCYMFPYSTKMTVYMPWFSHLFSLCFWNNFSWVAE